MTPLTDQLTALGLRDTAAHLDDVVALATKRRWSPTQLLEHLVTTEQQERTRRSLERRLARSRLGRFTPMKLRRSREVDRLRSAGVTQVRNARERGDQERDREQDEVIHRDSREVGQS
jgi:hypothetical protein